MCFFLVLVSTEPPSAPVNLSAHHHNGTALIVMWDPPHDWGGRKEVKYHVECETQTKDGSQWEACGEDVIFLPDSSGLTNTSVTVTGLNLQCDYRLSVQAWNDVSSQLRAPLQSTATVTIHRCKLQVTTFDRKRKEIEIHLILLTGKSPPVVITVTPQLITPEPQKPSPQHQSRFSPWLTVGILFGILLLMALIPIAVCALRRNYTKIS